MSNQGQAEKTDARRDWIAPAAVAAVLLAAYLPTMARIAIPGDSAELVTTVHTLGIPHPTGYPLFAMVGKLFDLAAPVGTVALRLNLFAALLGVATGVAITWAYRARGGARPASALAGLAAGLFSVPWGQALSFEVYTMHTLLAALALAAFVRWRMRPTPRRLAALAGVGGLALSHHGTAMFVVIPLWVAAVALHRPLGLRLLLKCAGLALLSFAAYAFLPINSLRDPYVRWGDASTFTAFKDLVTGKMFWSYVGSHGAQRMEPLELLGWLAGRLRMELTLPGAALLLVGWCAWWRRDRAFWACTTAALALSLLWVSVYRVLDQPVFLIACFAIFGLWLAAGAEAAAGWLSRFVPAARRWVLVALAVGLPLKLAATNLAAVDMSSDLSTDRQIFDHARLTLHHLKPGAIAVLRGHSPHSTALYLQQCEGMRPDVAVVSSGLSSYSWYVSKHTNPIVVQAIEDAMPALRRLPDAEYWQLNWCPHLTSAIARLALPETPLYVNQRFEPPSGLLQLNGPPVEEMTLERPDLARPDAPGQKTAAEFPLGIALLEAIPKPARVRRGDFFHLRLLWRCAQVIEQPVAVDLVFILDGAGPLLTANAVRFLPSGDEGWLPGKERDAVRRVAFGEAHPLLHGLLPLEANAPGHHYEREVPFVAASGATPGRYRIYLTVRTAGQSAGPFAVGELTVLPRRGG